MMASSNIWGTLGGDRDSSVLIPLINEMLDPWRLSHSTHWRVRAHRVFIYWEIPSNLLPRNLLTPQQKLFMVQAGLRCPSATA